MTLRNDLRNDLRLRLEKVDFRQPTQVTDDTSVLALKGFVLEPLLHWQPHGQTPRPGLLGSWEELGPADDGGGWWRWRFTVRPGATFHDGAACTARHVVDFVEAIRASTDTFGMRWSYHRYLAGSRLEVAAGGDERVVCLAAPEPLAHILDVFTEFYVCRADAAGDPVLGTGPYRVAEWDRPAGRAVLERTETGRAETEGWPERIVATADPDADSRLRAVLAGEADAALNLERAEDASRLFEEPSSRGADEPPSRAHGLRWQAQTSTLSVMCYLNCRAGESVFASPAARLAANLAVDRSALARDVFRGLAEPAAAVVSPAHLGYAEAALAAVPHDPAEARRLLAADPVFAAAAAAGDAAADGDSAAAPTLTLRTPTFMPERAVETAQAVAEDLRAAGFGAVRVEVEADRAGYARQVGLSKRTGDAAVFDSSPAGTFRVLDDKVSAGSRGVWWQGYEDGEAEALMAAARAVPAARAGERRAAYGLVLRRLRDNPPWLLLVHPRVVMASRGEGLRLDERGVAQLVRPSDDCEVGK